MYYLTKLLKKIFFSSQYLWCGEFLPWSNGYPQLDSLQPLHWQLILHARQRVIYFETNWFLNVISESIANTLITTGQRQLNTMLQKIYLWIFHCALSLFCMHLYPLLEVNNSLFEALKAAVLHSSFSILFCCSKCCNLRPRNKLSSTLFVFFNTILLETCRFNNNWHILVGITL